MLVALNSAASTRLEKCTEKRHRRCSAAVATAASERAPRARSVTSDHLRRGERVSSQLQAHTGTQLLSNCPRTLRGAAREIGCLLASVPVQVCHERSEGRAWT